MRYTNRRLLYFSLPTRPCWVLDTSLTQFLRRRGEKDDDFISKLHQSFRAAVCSCL